MPDPTGSRLAAKVAACGIGTPGAVWLPWSEAPQKYIDDGIGKHPEGLGHIVMRVVNPALCNEIVLVFFPDRKEATQFCTIPYPEYPQ